MPHWTYLGDWLSLLPECSGILMHHVCIPWGCRLLPSHIKLEALRAHSSGRLSLVPPNQYVARLTRLHLAVVYPYMMTQHAL